MARGAALFVCLVACVLGHAGEPTPTADEVERDRLIALITSGKDVEGNSKKLQALITARQKSEAAAEAEKRTREAAAEADRRTREAAAEAEKRTREAARQWRQRYQKSADYDLGWRCTASVDPRHPVPSSEQRFFADWGRVVKKEAVRLAPKNALDEGEPATLLEIAGQVRHYFIRAEKFGPGFPPRDVTGDVGDWMLVCDGDNARSRVRGADDWAERMVGIRPDDPSARAPEYWRGRLQKHGFAAAIIAPPKIVQKARWNPIHITLTNYYWAIHDVKWKYPPGRYVLTNLELSGEIDGRWEVSVEHGLSFLVEVPPSLPRREALVAGRNAWIILGEPRFDRALHKLVLVAFDVEPSYVTEK
jgi:hypothetical protein